MRVILTGGGTGGHIYPALALYRIWKERYPETEFLYIGTENGLESSLVPRQNIPFKSIEIQGFRRSLSLKNFQTVYKFLASVRKSKQLISEFDPDIILGTGGFVCGPVVYSATQLGIPSCVHEQNSIPGLTNKFLARYVDRIATCFEDTAQYFPKHKEKVILTGNPRAQEVASLERAEVLEDYGLDSDKPTVLIFGGSRGAYKINQMTVAAFDFLSRKDYQVLFATGESYYKDEIEGKDLQLNTETFKTVPYIPNMPEVFTNVSMVVARSGATSLAEITALGLPSVLIPSPNVTNDHQTKNADSLAKRGAAKLLSESELTVKQLTHDIDTMMSNTELRQEMSAASLEMGIQNAGDLLMDAMLAIMKT